MARHSRWTMLAATAVTLSPDPLAAAPVVTETIIYYDVDGSTEQEVRANLDRLAPLDENGRRFHATTKWSLSWRFDHQPGQQGCSITNVNIPLQVTTIMPRLNSDQAPAPLREAFATYAERLLFHEKGHVRIGIDTAEKMDAAIRELPPHADCQQLSSAANALGFQIAGEGGQRNHDYDAETRHGETQGVRFPLKKDERF
jgi:predicted secreted Zn-dependent protease